MRVLHFHTLNSFVLALALLFSASSVLAAATLMGVVRENQLGGSPAKKVQVTAAGANPVITGDDGRFVLYFPEHHPGEEVIVNVLRSGWVVINHLQLRSLLPAKAAQSPLDILISKTADRETWALQFYQLKGHHVVETEYKSKLAKLEGRNAAGAEERVRLLRERDRALAQVDKLARQIAFRQAENASEDYWKAVSLFLDGRMDEALDLLREDWLNHRRQMQKSCRSKSCVIC